MSCRWQQICNWNHPFFKVMTKHGKYVFARHDCDLTFHRWAKKSRKYFKTKLSNLLGLARPGEISAIVNYVMPVICVLRFTVKAKKSTKLKLPSKCQHNFPFSKRLHNLQFTACNENNVVKFNEVHIFLTRCISERLSTPKEEGGPTRCHPL